MSRPRLVDVAREAGVSVGAASDALAGKNRIPEETRQRVREAADRLGYVPNPIARAMTGGHLPLIGFVIGALNRDGEFEAYRDYWAEVIGAGTLAATRRGYAFVILPGLEVGGLSGLGFAAVIVIDAAPDDPDLARALTLGVPVMADQPDNEAVAVRLRLPYDQALGITLDHFLAEGASRPALLMHDVPTPYTAVLKRTYAQWCATTGHDHLLEALAIDDPVPPAVERLLDGGADAVFLALQPFPSIDLIQAALERRGLALGRDLRLVVFDEDLGGRIADRGVSTVTMSLAAYIDRAAESLIDVVEHKGKQPEALLAAYTVNARTSSRSRPV